MRPDNKHDISVVILTLNYSTDDVFASINSFRSAGVERVLLLNSSTYGMFPVVDAKARMFHSGTELVKETDGGWTFVTSPINVPSNFLHVVSEKPDGIAYGLSGCKIIRRTATGKAEVEFWSRGPSGVRFLNNDTGDRTVDVFDKCGYLLPPGAMAAFDAEKLSYVLARPILVSTSLRQTGFRLVCLDTPWGRPVRLPTRNVEFRSIPELPEFPELPDMNLVKAPEEEAEPMTAVDLPILSIVFLTHNRTTVASYCLKALCSKLRYSGRIHYCICDDRSEPGHVDSLESVLRENGVTDYSVERTTDERWGIGASMNNGLRKSFLMTDVVLTMEDDFFLARELDITDLVRTVMSDNIAGIRLASVFTVPNKTGTTPTSVEDFGLSHGVDFWRVCGGTRPRLGEHYTFNNQVMLRNKRIYDFLGFYEENASPEVVETTMCARYSARCMDGRGSTYVVLYPKTLPLNTLNNGLFVHVGVSTLGHKCDIAKEYEWMNDATSGQLTFHIVTPFYNCSSKLERCLRSVASQRFPLDTVRMTVVDDASDDYESKKAEELCSKYDFVQFVRNSHRTMAGGARNTALRCGRGRECPYTVFLDADDMLISNLSLGELWSTIENNGKPDVVMCGFVFNKTGNKRVFSASSPADMAKENALAPWTRATKTEKVAEFVENRRVANDVVQFLRQVDVIDTVASMNSTFIRYMDDNTLSGWNGTAGRSNDAVFALCMVAPDILSENFTKPYVKERARKLMINHSKLALARLAHVKL